MKNSFFSKTPHTTIKLNICTLSATMWGVRCFFIKKIKQSKYLFLLFLYYQIFCIFAEK